MAGSGAPIRVSGKRALLVLAIGAIVLGVALYVVLVPMHFGGKERLQEEHRRHQMRDPQTSP